MTVNVRTVQLDDAPELLRAMMRGAERHSALWRPSPYWRGYCRRILRELDHRGLADVRVNQAVLKGFANGGLAVPTLPEAGWKRHVWRATERLPLVQMIVEEYRRLLRSEHSEHVRCRVGRAQLLVERIAADFPDMAPLPNMHSGGAEEAFDWNGVILTADWAKYLVRAGAFYRHAAREETRSAIEIGPGLGLSTLAHLALNPYLERVVNVDIPPVLYVSTQFLKAIPGIRVVDYLAFERDGMVERAENERCVVYQLAPWQLEAISGRFDTLLNAFSFQEMDRQLCAGYVEIIERLVMRHVMLHAARAEGMVGAEDFMVSLESLCDLFRDAFPRETHVTDPAIGLFEPPDTAVLLSRES